MQAASLLLLCLLSLYLGTAGAFVPACSLARFGLWCVSGQRCTQLPGAVRVGGPAVRRKVLLRMVAATPAAGVNDAHSPMEVLSLHGGPKLVNCKAHGSTTSSVLSWLLGWFDRSCAET
ncbi:hypothetical protein T484DRAFT_1744240 [Baffinella frigidus]|nr:hypothetical protein T484DRAFT_1744240 [Cryptophyta sp. CCMP2293]